MPKTGASLTRDRAEEVGNVVRIAIEDVGEIENAGIDRLAYTVRIGWGRAYGNAIRAARPNPATR